MTLDIYPQSGKEICCSAGKQCYLYVEYQIHSIPTSILLVFPPLLEIILFTDITTSTVVIGSFQFMK